MADVLRIIGLALVVVAGALHVGFFLLETVLWRGSGRRVFGVRRDDVETIRLWAWNQGWYNLFLAIGAIGGGTTCLVAWGTSAAAFAMPITAFVALSMVGAAIVAIASDRRLLRGALLQGLPPLLGIVALTGSALG